MRPNKKTQKRHKDSLEMGGSYTSNAFQTILLISWSLYKLCFPHSLYMIDFQGNHVKWHMIALR